MTGDASRRPGAGQDAAARFAIELCGQARVGLGCMGLTGIYGAVAREDAVDTLHAALDAGITMFDTAALYASGANEELLGDVLGGRGGIVVVTKFGLHEAADGTLVRDSRRATVRSSVEASLRRLKRERLDLVLQHRPDPAVPDPEVAGTVAELIAEGKVAAFGLSGTGLDRVDSWPATPRVSAVQNELSLSAPARSGEPSRLMAGGAVFMAYAPLGRGLLTGARPGAGGDLRAGMPGFQEAADAATPGPARVLGAIAARRGTSRALLALAWLLARSGNVVAIPGCRTRRQVEEIAGGGGVSIDPEDAAELDGAACPVRGAFRS